MTTWLLLCATLIIGASTQNAEDIILKESEPHFGKLEDNPNFSIKEDFAEGQESGPPHNFRYQIEPSDNSYNYRFNTLDSKRIEIGEIKDVGTDKETLVVQGKYEERFLHFGEWITRTIGYIADENGYRPFLINIKGEGIKRPEEVQYASPISKPIGPGAPAANRGGISSALIATLNGR